MHRAIARATSRLGRADERDGTSTCANVTAHPDPNGAFSPKAGRCANIDAIPVSDRAISPKAGRCAGICALCPDLGENRALESPNPAFLAQRLGLGEIGARKVPAWESCREGRRLLPAETSHPIRARMGRFLPRRDVVQISTRFLSPTRPFLPRRDDAPESARFVPPWEKVWRQGRRTRPSLHNVSAWERRSCVKFQLGRDSPRATSCLGRSSGDKGAIMGWRFSWDSNSHGVVILVGQPSEKHCRLARGAQPALERGGAGVDRLPPHAQDAAVRGAQFPSIMRSSRR